MRIKRFKELLTELKINFLNKDYYLRQFSQYTDIPYNKSCACDNCGHADFMKITSFDLIGFCDTKNGYMGVFECPNCGEVYRHHISNNRFDIDEFKETAAIIFNRQSRKKETV